MGQQEFRVGSGERLRAMAASLGGEIGLPFLERLVYALRDAMDASLVFITVGEGEPPTRARAIYAIEDGAEAENFEYDLKEAPCEMVYQGQIVTIPARLAELFPDEEGLSGYVGVPIRGDSDRVVGHLAVCSANPIEAPDAAENIVKIFAARVDAEQRYKQLLEERDQLIGQLTHANEMLQERHQALHDANQFKTSLLGMIAHDLRNPLAALISNTELLETRLNAFNPDREKLQNYAGKIMKSADRISGLIESTLSRCKEESSAVGLHPKRADLTQLVKGAVETNTREANRKSIAVSLTCPDNLWALVDGGLCLEAMDNLVSNAIKYSEPETRVDVCLNVNSSWIEFSVTDQGQGLSSEDIAQAFRPFQKLSATPTGGETATGLGLVNVRNIAEAHGGKVKVKSPGKGMGATFYIRLPVKTCAPSAGERDDEITKKPLTLEDTA